MEKIIAIMKHVEELTENSVKLYLAGGWLRNTMNGVTPKDIDIMVVPNDSYYDCFDFVSDVECFEEYTVTKDITELCQYLSDMQERGVSGLVMGNLNDGTELQFIVYEDNHTQQHITEDMDINICQITMDSDGVILETDAFVDGFARGHIEVLHDYSPKRKQSRTARMLKKYPTFTFTNTWDI